MTDPNEIHVNDLIKIVHNRERFWLIVTELSDPRAGLFIGTVDNDLLMEHDFQYGDEIEFHIGMICDHICQASD